MDTFCLPFALVVSGVSTSSRVHSTFVQASRTVQHVGIYCSSSVAASASGNDQIGSSSYFCDRMCHRRDCVNVSRVAVRVCRGCHCVNALLCKCIIHATVCMSRM